jgi:hypothetical protein
LNEPFGRNTNVNENIFWWEAQEKQFRDWMMQSKPIIHLQTRICTQIKNTAAMNFVRKGLDSQAGGGEVGGVGAGV